ncbi:DUF2634 domain-containing protein [Paenibacillus aceti]|uniref:DUF2634 domain-containing protein n=1 Tax=Paenibacillus aceti TaxID=1820010 RepID=A0ABQ1W6B8_9BACL|nr:DUF2634 domain-containing protein [Paenibacillus aceti]GGG13554.1 hypothetical protein GCM10010913_39180 [Paenibacillus aceti]
MIPIGGNLTPELEKVQETSRTYRLDFQNNRMAGMTDGLDAVRQAVYKILQTERFAHLIYSNNYGFEGHSLIGRNSGYVRAELNRRVSEALLQDDRISEITEFQVDIQEDQAVASFLVHSLYGDFRMEVNANV